MGYLSGVGTGQFSGCKRFPSVGFVDNIVNWYRIAQSNDNRGGMFENMHGSKRLYYSISGAKKIPGRNEWILDMSKAPELSKQVGEAEVGDGVWDYNLNSTLGEVGPIWTVVWIDEKGGTLTVVPTEDNPLSSGRGAGGKLIDDFDYLVQSGEWETKEVDRVLEVIQSRNYHQPADVAYVLLGTVPMRFGTNGAEGGWYSAHNTRSNRGGMMGMSVAEIVMKDAKALKKMGFTLPVGAIEGEMGGDDWTNFVNGFSMSSGASKEMRFDSEGGGGDLVYLIERERNPKIVDILFERLLESGVEDKISEAVETIGMKGDNEEDMDPYFRVKETVIGWAKRKGRGDLILPFAKSGDSDVSLSAMRALAEMGAADPIELMRGARRMKALYYLTQIAENRGRGDDALGVLEDRMEDIKSPKTPTDQFYSQQILNNDIPKMRVNALIKKMGKR
jgi:hypothetical protein